MEIIDVLIESNFLEVIFKLVLSAFLAGLIGLERSSLNKPAGFGTHAIIGVSAALVVMASEYMAVLYPSIDASRIPSQIIAGIGFIGAGTIITNGFTVKGVTTAAGILSVTCIGIAVGMGYYSAAIITTIIVFFIMSINHDVTSKFERYEYLSITLVINGNLAKIKDELEKYFKSKKITIQSIKKENIINNKKSEKIFINAMFDTKEVSKNKIISDLIEMEDIDEVIDNN